MISRYLTLFWRTASERPRGVELLVGISVTTRRRRRAHDGRSLSSRCQEVAEYLVLADASQKEGTNAMGSAPGTCAGPRFGDSRAEVKQAAGRRGAYTFWRFISGSYRKDGSEYHLLCLGCYDR